MSLDVVSMPPNLLLASAGRYNSPRGERLVKANPVNKEQPAKTATGPDAERLDSWKEIAQFLRRDVRTVQRWERSEGLPVHRHQHAKRGSVYAHRSELSGWWEARRPSLTGIGVGAKAVPPRSAASGEHLKPKVAVLPLENLSRNPRQEYFSDGLTEELITQIGLVAPERLAVVARTTAMHYKGRRKRVDQVGRDLGAEFVLEGSVRTSGARHVRIAAHLVQVRDQTRLWSETYDRDLGDILEVQKDVAQAVAQKILSEVAPAPTAKKSARIEPRAYQAYLQGRYHSHDIRASGLLKSLQFFERAVALDPSYALAHAGLADAYGILAIVPYDALAPREAMPNAEAAARRALALDPSLAEAHAALALVDNHYHWKWAAAEEGYRRAIELNPDYAAAHIRLAWLLMALGRHADAFERIEIAQRRIEETDPLRLVVIHATRAAALYFARDFNHAIAECEAGLALDTSQFMLHYILGRSAIRAGDYPRARMVINVFLSAKEKDSITLVALGHAAAVAGRKADAEKVLAALRKLSRKRYVPATYFAMVEAGLGRMDEAFKWLEKAYDERADGLTWLNCDPMVDGLRADPRFQSLVRRIGLVPTESAKSTGN